jgi:hypothetical protein
VSPSSAPAAIQSRRSPESAAASATTVAHISHAKRSVCGRPKVAYMTGIGESAVSTTTAAAGSSSAARRRTISATAGSARHEKTSDGTRNAAIPGDQSSRKCSSQKWTGPPPRCVETMWKMWRNEKSPSRSVSSSSTFSGVHHTVGSASQTSPAAAATTAAGRTARLIGA